jgi:hypothetical protein
VSQRNSLTAKAVRRAEREIPDVATVKYNFTCGHCGERHVQSFWRNACPKCHWSKHVFYGEQVGYSPCGALMKPELHDDATAVWTCECGFTIAGPTEREMARLARLGLRWKWQMRYRDESDDGGR